MENLADSRNFFDNVLFDFEHGSLMSRIEKQSLRKPPPPSILILIKTKFLFLFRFWRIMSIKAGRLEHTIIGSSMCFTILVSLSS